MYENEDYFLNNERTTEQLFKDFNDIPSTLDWSKPLQTWKKFKMDYNVRYSTKCPEEGAEKGEGM